MLGAIFAVAFVSLFGAGVVALFVLAARRNVRFTRRRTMDWSRPYDPDRDSERPGSDSGWLAGLAAVPVAVAAHDALSRSDQDSYPDADDSGHRTGPEPDSIKHGLWDGGDSGSTHSGGSHWDSGGSDSSSWDGGGGSDSGGGSDGSSTD